MSCTFVKSPKLLPCFVFIYRYVDVRYGNITNLYKWFGKQVECVYFYYKNINIFNRWPRGLMDKASDFGSEDWGFESLRGRFFLHY